MCDIIQLPARAEVWGFGGSHDGAFWKQYDWTQVTAVGFLNVETLDPNGLMCHAHAHGARVFLKAETPPVAEWVNATARHAWVAAQLVLARRSHADGINFDFEEALPARSAQAAMYATLVVEMKEAARAALPGFQVSVDVAWSPAGIDGRWFDYGAMAAAADVVFVMAYDMQSQVYGRCVAQANAPLEMVRWGLEQYLAMGVPAAKMVLGVPWYGYTYPCEGHPPPDVDFCVLPSTPFRNVSCSDAAGKEIGLSDILSKALPNASTPLRTEPLQRARFFNYRAAGGAIKQLWFDDVESLTAKYSLAAELGLLGVGPWTFDMVYPHLSEAQVDEMWDAFEAFSRRRRPRPVGAAMRSTGPTGYAA